MRNNETGEFELVVGNKQLLSGFAIVVLLFGVGVAMGYILGQNSPRSAKLQPETTAAAAAPAASDARPLPAAPASAPPPAPAPEQPSATAAAQPSPTEPPPDTRAQPATQPARESNPAAAQPPPLPAPVVAAASPLPEAPPGNYWQVMAIPQADAEVVARTLKEQGFPALLSPGTKGLTRVLVGPYKDTQAMGKAKTLLESNGFHPVKKSSE